MDTNVVKRLKRVLIAIVLAAALVVIAYLILRWLHGTSLSPRQLVYLGRAVLDSGDVTGYSQGDLTNIIFLHHSTGRNLIEQGGMRGRLTAANYAFWDHDYAWPGLRDPDGAFTNYDYGVPDDNTDPDGLAAIFAQPVYGIPVNALSGLLQHEVVIIKSCFPVSNITTDEQLERYQSYYLGIRDVMDSHQDKAFIILTPPPLIPSATTPQAATRARAFADWLKSTDFLAGHANIFVFDFFDQLAEPDPAAADYNMLRQGYREGSDSHPSRTANETIGPRLVEFVIEATGRYRTMTELD